MAETETKRPIENSGAPVRDEQGNIIGAELVFRDIAEHKRVKEEKTHSQRLLLALSQAAQTVQRARTPAEVYKTIGDEVVRLGFDATILTLTDDRQHLTVAHTTFSAASLQAAEKMAGLSVQVFHIPLTSGGFFHRIVSERTTVFHERAAELTAEAVPKRLRPLAVRLAAGLGLEESITAPLIVSDETACLLVVTGAGLTEADMPAVSTFANQAAIAIENAWLYKETQQLAAFSEDIIQSMAEGIVVEDADGFLTFVNPAAAELLGYAPDELVGLHWKAIIPFDQQPIVQAANERRMRGENDRYELELARQDGCRISVLVSGSPRFGEEGHFDGMMAVFTDITERKRAEEALRNSEERYRSFVQNFRGIAYRGSMDFTPIFFHGAVEEITGYAEWEFLDGKPRWDQVIHPEDLPVLLAEGEENLHSIPHFSYEREYRIVRKDGEVRWVHEVIQNICDDSGGPAMVQGSIYDITVSKHAEEALQQRASQLALLNEIGRRVTAFLDLDEVLHRAAQLVQEHFGFHHVGLFTKADSEDRLVMRARAGEFAPLFPPDHSVALGQGLVGWVGLHGENLLANDVEVEPRYVNLYPDRLPTRSELSVAIRIGEEIVGVLDLQSPQPNAFDSSDVTTNETLADWLAVAIQNARLFHETQQQLDELGLLFAASVTFSLSLDLDTVLETTARQITAALQAEGCAISWWDREQDALVTMLDYSLDLVHWKPDPLGTSYPLADYAIFRRVVVDRQPVAVQVDDPGADPAEVALLTAQGVKSLVMVPLVARDEAIGLLELVEMHEKRAYSPAEMRLVQTLANQTAAALVNARLYDEARRRSRELALLNRVIAATAAGQALEPSLEVVCRELALAFDVPQSVTALFNKEKTEAVVVAEYHAEGRPSGLGDVIPMVGNPLVAWLLAHKAPLAVDDAQSDPRLAPVHDVMRRRGTVSLVLLPLMVDGDVLGSLGMAAIAPRAFSSEEVNLARRVAEQVSGVLARARLREEHRQMEEQFHQSQKMEAIGRLAGGIAHDFNNLLTVIHLSTRLLERKLHPEDPLWTHLQRIQDAGLRATNLTRQLLAFGRQEMVKPQVLDLNQVLGELDKMLRRIIGEDVELTLLPAREPWPVKINPTQVEQVVINLAVNARDAMPKGGKLTIETTNMVLDEDYAARHMEVEPGEYLMLTVSDTGVGMGDEVMAHIFEPFFTTKERDKGTGLGLATVFGIIKQNGGHIGVYSEPGQGTTFKIYLPRVSESIRAPSHLPTERAALPRGSETLLLVEDDAQVRELTREILLAQGYRVLVARDGVEALKVAPGHEGPIHLLLTDVVMPRMSGKALADQMQSSRPEMRVLYTSGYTDDAILHHGVLNEGTHFLSKPFELEALARKVRTVLDA